MIGKGWLMVVIGGWIELVRYPKCYICGVYILGTFDLGGKKDQSKR